MCNYIKDIANLKDTSGNKVIKILISSQQIDIYNEEKLDITLPIENYREDIINILIKEKRKDKNSKVFIVYFDPEIVLVQYLLEYFSYRPIDQSTIEFNYIDFGVIELLDTIIDVYSNDNEIKVDFCSVFPHVLVSCGDKSIIYYIYEFQKEFNFEFVCSFREWVSSLKIVKPQSLNIISKEEIEAITGIPVIVEISNEIVNLTSEELDLIHDKCFSFTNRFDVEEFWALKSFLK